MLDLPQYTLSQKVYEGSETAVYRGHRDGDGVAVAVKVTRNDYPAARELARLRREFGVLQDIRHLPGVGKGIALEKYGRGLALVLEDLGSTSLHDVLRAGPLDVATTLTLAISLADTLDALHRLQVIHKDIKPHNIMVAAGPSSPRIVDFGIAARLAQETQKATSPGALEGTLAYLSPEQTGRMNRVVDRRTDLYSLGVTFYEMLTGALPFAGADPTEIIHGHIARVPTPPHERATGIPRGLSDVVLRLLAKTPEERYQSARGLKVDLERCLAEWIRAGQIEPFPLGRQDITGELRIPQKLYGREAEVEALLGAFDRARGGAVELVLVSGYAGVGKSALVNEIHKPIARQGGYFVRGKFDQVSRSTPLAPVAQAFRELIRHILAEPPSALEAWKTKLLLAVAGSGKLLFDLIPELELVLGPQPEAPVLGPTEARNRFGLLVQRFLRVFTTPEHPLALFLDDLQWADPASLHLLSGLLADPESKHLLLIGSYRDNEVDAAHPLLAALDEARKAGARLVTLALAPLDLDTTTAFLAEALRARAADVAELAAIVFDKTQGNPFFLSQFLGALHDAHLLVFDFEAGAFTWDVERVRGAMVTDNVLDLMLGKLARLTPGTRRALLLAACIGHEFDLDALATIAELPLDRAAADLWEALREGLVVPLGDDYRFLDESADAGVGADASVGADFQIAYRFLHDRVREAAYSLIAPEKKEEVHLSIGRLLWARSGKIPRDEDLLEIVCHLNQSRCGLTDPAERAGVAALDLRAGKRVKAATAYQAAAGYFDAGAALLGDAGWESAYELCFALHLESVECAFLSGESEQTEARFEVILRRAKTDLERARIHNLRMVLHATRASFTDAVNAGVAGLALLGVTMPEAPAERQAAFGAGLGAVAKNLGGRRIADLVDAEELASPTRRAAIQLLCDLALPIFYVSPDLYGLVVLEQVNTSLEHGPSDISPMGYMAHGFMLAAMLGQPAEGYAFGALALALHERLPNAALNCKLNLVFAGYFYLREPVREVVALYERACKTALEAGDYFYLASASYYGLAVRFALGFQLDDVRAELTKAHAIAQRTRDITSAQVLLVVKQALANLQGQTRSRSTLSDEGFDEQSFLASLSEKEQGITLAFFHLFKLHLQYLHGDYAGAVASAADAERWSASIFGHYYATRIHFYACLAHLRLPPAGTLEAEAQRRESIARHKARTAALASVCPKNFQHELVLIEAEEARVAGKSSEAFDLYDRAIALAKANDFPHDDALANELAARLYLAVGKDKLARPYMTDAHLGYLAWGATAKAEDLARDHERLLPRIAEGGSRSSTSGSAPRSITGLTTILNGTTIGSLREAALVVRAAQAIAGEIALPSVIRRLLKIVIENAGAQQGALLLSRDDRLFVDATFSVNPDVIEVGPHAPLDACEDVAHSVALFVARTREAVVLDDTSVDARFVGDPRLAAGLARSVLCLPLVHQGRLSGLLYLEHREAKAAFNTARVELLELFASQAAIAVENALLVADVREANEQVRHVNERLEAEVAQRTSELESKNRELGHANQRLQIELTQREQAERERAALQERMIDAQRSRLLEMSTPLIPITDRIMVMPLIGTVDAERAEQVLEAALEGAQRHRARVVILDITGMKHIDIQVVSSLLRTAAALLLLGAQAVLTGIRPEVARAMVNLGVDLSTIVTRGTLQSGIAYALERCGEPSALTGRTEGRFRSQNSQ
jgi:predicted ATPase/GAF domain-containing protein/tRNA A-37 threonylcarbamoyl transferase component Bud32